MKLGHIEILAADPDEAKRFYCEVLGFEVETIQNERFIWLKKDGLEILVRPGKPHNPALRYEDAPTGFVFYTDDVKAALKDLLDKGVEIKGTVDSSKCYTFTDPDGNWFQLVNPDDH
jgi:catechol 2,3-dioxygenase-like lactoylglutathione lyase family enzyme